MGMFLRSSLEGDYSKKNYVCLYMRRAGRVRKFEAWSRGTTMFVSYDGKVRVSTFDRKGRLGQIDILVKSAVNSEKIKAIKKGYRKHAD